MGKKYYAVIRGREPGIYRNWSEAKKQVDRFSHPVYKGFLDYREALEWAQVALSMGDYPKDVKEHHNDIQYHGQAGKEKQLVEKEVHVPKEAIHVYTDGGSRNTGIKKGQHVRSTDKSAWAFRIDTYEGKSYTDTGSFYGRTNNQMELYAFGKACEKLLQLGTPQRKTPILFILDSIYVLNPLENGSINKWDANNWSEDRANKEYWQEIWSYYSQLQVPIFFKWVRGHADTEGNIFVDKLLNETMDKMG